MSVLHHYKQLTRGLLKLPYTKCRNDRQPVKVLNRLNDRQSNLYGSWAKWRSDQPEQRSSQPVNGQLLIMESVTPYILKKFQKLQAGFGGQVLLLCNAGDSGSILLEVACHGLTAGHKILTNCWSQPKGTTHVRTPVQPKYNSAETASYTVDDIGLLAEVQVK